MNKEDTFIWVQEETSELYWKFRDSLDDKGAEKLSQLVNRLDNDISDILLEHLA